MERFSCFKCEECGKKMYLRRAVCQTCKGRSFQQIDIEETGTVLTYTKLYATPEGIEDMPLVLGIMEFGDGVRLTGQIADQDVKVGDKVRPIWGKIRRIEGKDIFGMRFKLVK